MSNDTKCLTKLKIWRDNVNWTIEEDRHRLRRQMYPLIRHWKGRLPNLRDNFEKDEIEWLLAESLKAQSTDHKNELLPLVEFLIKTGYKDEPNVDKDGKPLLRCTTPVHLAARRKLRNKHALVRDLFKIYNRFDVNYTDESGLTHFHVACMAGFFEIVQKYLELGQDPNFSIHPPLQLALFSGDENLARLLLMNGADPNFTDADGSTLLHNMCKRDDGDYLAKLFFKINDEDGREVTLDAADNRGNTPLHLALDYGMRVTTELLLRHGADPNLADPAGYTPLHIVCMRADADDFVRLFFEICDERQQPVLVDARDECGRTPLRWAVARLLVNTVDALLDHGADLSNFEFPTESQIAESVRSYESKHLFHFKLLLASSVLSILESLEKRGYELDRSNALILMKLFAAYGLFEVPCKYVQFYKMLMNKSKALKVRAGLSLHDLIQLRPRQAVKLQLTCRDYHELARTAKFHKLPRKQCEDLFVHLCEKMSRRFFKKWALDTFMELTSYRLPVLCCEMIIEPLMNQDLYRICLAAEDKLCRR
uniref:PRANC domain-containing protein n=1 Tax=Trichogramma kaykai TaxID=54128 RepID=A0ABD2VVX3_9HYME